MDKKIITAAIEAVEQRAFLARVTMAEVCKEADIAHASWSNAKRRGRIGVRLLRDVEAALGRIEGKRNAS